MATDFRARVPEPASPEVAQATESKKRSGARMAV